MRQLIVYILSLCFSSTVLSAFEWSLQVTDPDFELRHYKLDEKNFKPYLAKTSWRCFIGPVEKKAEQEMRTIRCNYSIEKTGEVKLFASCGPDRNYNETLFELFDEKKDLLFKFLVTCQLTKTTGPKTN